MLPRKPISAFEETMFNEGLAVKYTPGDAPKKPEIILQIKDDCPKDIREQLEKLFKSWPYRITNNNQLLISGNRPVSETLNALVTYADNVGPPSDPYDKIAKETLLSVIIDINTDIKKQNEIKHKQKPILAKVIQDDTFTKNDNIAIDESLNVVTPVTKKSKKDQTDKLYFLKKRMGALSEIESFNSELFILLLGSDRVARSRSTYDESGMRQGNISREIKYTPFEDYFNAYLEKNPNATMDQINQMVISLDYAAVEVANYVFKENDAHWRNVGVKDGKIVRIDFDQALWWVAFKYFGHDANLQSQVDDVLLITQRDMANLPVLQDRVARHNLQSEYRVRNIESELEYIRDDITFQNSKWYHFLKYILIGDDIYNARLDACISSVNLKKEIFKGLIADRERCKSEIIYEPLFYEYLKNNPNAINQIISEFDKLKKLDVGIKGSLNIDPAVIQNNYDKLSRMIDVWYGNNDNNTKFQAAVLNRFTDSVREIFLNEVENNFNPTIVKDMYTHAISNNIDIDIVGIAIELAQSSRENLEAVKFLLEMSGSENIKKNINIQRLLWKAVDYNWLDIVKILINAGVDPNSNVTYIQNGMKKIETPLHRAVCNNNIEIVDTLCSHPNIDLNSKDGLGVTPLHEAAGRGNVAVINILLRKGCDPNLRDNDHFSPLSFAAYNRQMDAVEKLSATINQTDSEGRTDLHIAVIQGWTEVVEILLNSEKINPNIVDINGRTAFDYACQADDKDLMKLLVQNSKFSLSPDTNAKSSPLYIAIQNTSDFACQLILNEMKNRKIDINNQDKKGDTQINLAAEKGDVVVLRKLLEFGADPTIKNIEGKTALDYAIAYAKKNQENTHYQSMWSICDILKYELNKLGKKCFNYSNDIQAKLEVTFSEMSVLLLNLKISDIDAYIEKFKLLTSDVKKIDDKMNAEHPEEFKKAIESRVSMVVPGETLFQNKKHIQSGKHEGKVPVLDSSNKGPEEKV